MKKKKLSVTFERIFNFLKDDYSICTISSTDEDWGYSYIGKNETTGIKIRYEFYEAYIFITLYKLVNNQIIDNTDLAIKNNEVINGFALDVLIEIRNKNSQIKPAYQYGEDSEFYLPNVGLENYVNLFANNLKKYANDVLNGDFKIFEQCEKILRDKYKDYYNN